MPILLSTFNLQNTIFYNLLSIVKPIIQFIGLLTTIAIYCYSCHALWNLKSLEYFSSTTYEVRYPAKAENKDFYARLRSCMIPFLYLTLGKFSTLSVLKSAFIFRLPFGCPESSSVSPLLRQLKV